MHKQTRRQFLRSAGLAMGTAGMIDTPLVAGRRGGQERPNILWITSEDNSPLLGCYGDEQAHTPNLDRLARQGVRYRNAFANAPVCSAARSTLIIGMLASSVGLHNHRSKVRIPDSFRSYPEYLRESGYYCTNNSKTDYNYTRKADLAWDESSNKAHYDNRKPGQPFFAIFNIGLSHEGQLTDKAVSNRRKRGILPPRPRIAPEDVKFPPYHADTPVVRRDWSIYYDNVTLMDKEVGRLLKELDDKGLAENTVVFYYSDHGGALPRGKRNIHDSGTRVPVIIRFPKKWAHLAPADPGEWVDQPVSFVDFPATVFSLAGVPIPKHFEGRAFLGEQAGKLVDHVYLFRGRMDERYDTVRAVRNRRYRYVRNYSPHRPWGQRYSYPFRVMPSMKSWYQAYVDGKCNAVQARYWHPKPSEEFYDIESDPYEVMNLIDEPRHAARIAQMRETLRRDIVRTRDIGFIPEGMFERLAGGKTLYEYAQSDAYPIERIVDFANLAASRDASALRKLLAACDDPHPVIRYWRATGCLILQEEASQAKKKLKELLEDQWDDIRVVAAEALSYLGETELALGTMKSIIDGKETFATLAALNSLDYMMQAGHVSVEGIQKMVKGKRFKNVSSRMVDYFNAMT
ncbi:MAG: sulfatase-like hydrolase/transferase [Phycisphaerales bacterium]|nr:MAG: sulfatase-like hydrolase/transferase [Phycisphaerales bacterium]